MSNPFYVAPDYYKRDLDFLNGAMNDAALYLSLQTGDPLDQCLSFVKTQLRPDGPTPISSPATLILDKNPEGDRQVKTVSFMQFINRVNKQNLLLSPSLTAYMPEHIRKSTHAEYIEEGVANRKKVKNEMLAAERTLQDTSLKPQQITIYKDLVLFKKGAQNNLKINNNSYSGATVSEATILHYKSTHSSLTSTCRTATSYANSANEKFIAGNRHYYSPEITKANLLFIMNNAELDLIDSVIKRLGLVYPSVDDVMDMVNNSTNHYWKSPEQNAIIRHMLEGATPVQLAAIMYVGDMYHLFSLNREVITAFLTKLSTVTPSEDKVDKDTYKKYDGDLKLHGYFLCFEQVRGRDEDTLKRDEPEVLDLVRSTTRHASNVMMEYQDLLRAFFMSKCMPHSIFAFPTIYRKAVPVSDTDSTMFTLQWWVEQIFGKVIFTAEATRIVFALVFLISEMVLHLLAMLSANMGVGPAKMRLLAMKNEYYFAVLNLNNRSKHYFASQDAQEGIVFPKSKMEIKGVGNRDSKVPAKINKSAKTLMKEIIETIKSGELIDVTEILTRVANIERSIIKSLQEGRFEYLTTGQIKTPGSYKTEEENASYKQYELWQDVFAPTYGATQAPPYSVVKISTIAKNRTEMEAWYEKMDNPQLVERFKEWMLKERKTEIATLLIPAAVVEGTGVPKAITCAIDTRRIIANTMGTFYLTLESLGIYMIDKNSTRLVSDYY